MTELAPRRSRWLPLMSAHLLAALLAAAGGIGSLWWVLENLGWDRATTAVLILLTVVTALSGVCSLLIPLGALLVRDHTAWWERLLALAIGSVVGGMGAGVVVLFTAMTFGVAAGPVGIIIGGAALLVFLLATIAALIVRGVNRNPRWPVLLVAAGSQVVVVQFLPWWVVGTVLIGGEIS